MREMLFAFSQHASVSPVSLYYAHATLNTFESRATTRNQGFFNDILNILARNLRKFNNGEFLERRRHHRPVCSLARAKLEIALFDFL
jgi:hypothetical protein